MTCAPAHAYFEHAADIGVIGRGATLETALVEAARATFAIMTDGMAVPCVVSVGFEFDEQDPELALVVWLNRLLAEAHARGLVFGSFELARDQGHYRARACGAAWADSLVRGTEVKGATLTALSVRQNETGWEARCVVDV